MKAAPASGFADFEESARYLYLAIFIDHFPSEFWGSLSVSISHVVASLQALL
jgi:hypothetical protein